MPIIAISDTFSLFYLFFRLVSRFALLQSCAQKACRLEMTNVDVKAHRSPDHKIWGKENTILST